ncbi:FAD-dependent oxidoreductase [Streptomyces litchfieldiae]|uniref:FAD-dependent oxidoreductase n=1 Tax=Streptomyces litchfieldiae TaxID=3075543 RepID=A0ABU2MVX8_9ACTN|nr:FAD-dependent oxidoreductase [Streptomyces sp. DSM 44938]MDT0345735.1 FAD-dependent oxidoreductase [Streptomyces sp. DSM 44938]
MRGDLLRPGDGGFDMARELFNPLTDDRVPAAVARCASVSDVREAVLAAGGRVPVAARGGGHSYVGYSAPPQGLAVDLRLMSGVEVLADGSAVIGAGAVLGDVYRGLAQANRCLPGGTCPTVGIAGLTLGGGIGVLQRKFGLTCDHLTAVEIVMADGTVRTVSETSSPDLFWALRGGGGGNFGIVTSFVFTTDAAPAPTVFRLRFPAGRVPQVLSGWQPWISSAPRALWANLNISGSDTAPKCSVSGCYVGPGSDCAPLLDDLERRCGVRPDSRSMQEGSYLDAMGFFSGNTGRQSFVASSRVLGRPTDDPAALVRTMEGRRGIALILDPLGGAITDVPPGGTAFPHRTAFATAQIYASATAATEAEVTRKVGEVVAGLGALGVGGGYVNYIDPALPDWAAAYYGAGLERLRSVARACDPHGVFAFPQGLTRA